MLVNKTILLIALLFIATAILFIRVHRKYNARKIILIFQALLSFYVTSFCFYLTFDLYSDSPTFLFMQDKILGMSFNLEPIGIIFMDMVSALWFLTSLYSIGYVDLNKEINATKFSFFMIGAVSSAFMLAISGDLITSFFFYELLTLLTFPLIIGTGALKEIKAARKYLLTLMGLSLVLLLPAIAIVYSESGNVAFIPGGILRYSNVTSSISIIVFIMFMYGIAKTAIMPVHSWLVSAMAAPVPVSALLHAVAVVKSGLLIMLKICIYIYGIDYLAEIFKPICGSNLVVILCSASVIFSSIFALSQSNIKKLLAYSTINHMSICLLSCFMFSVKGIKAAVLHMLGHGVSKLSLFFAAGIVESKYGGADIANLNGLAKKSESLALLFTIAILSMIGLPPLAGFVGKFYIFYAASSNEIDYLAIISISISILISASYFMRLIYDMYFIENKIPGHKANKQDVVMKFATMLGCASVLFYALSFPFLMEFMDKIQFESLIDILKEVS
jgi:multicomponent Na+:H+ antiporter subunit D